MKKIAIFVLSVVSLFLVVGCSNSTSGGFNNLPDHLGDNKAIANLTDAGATYNYLKGDVDLEKEDDHETKEKKRYYWLDHINEVYSDYLDDAKEKVENKEDVDIDDVATQYGYLYKYYTTAEEYLDDSDRKTELLNDYYKTLVGLKKLYDDNADS
ncbi:hypothetical protein SAMN05660328_103209 [Streptococcus gallolyticus]|uniref:Lipoprotein n=1 Tax=Streptococcus gallolyticus TaxID=315405 RepID=A0A1I7HMZ7_9STRE|nr:hypothetical protein [Streptococcus gallolyticus]SFC20717.1 hypothetical protein SAMN02983012_0951 [Streptococcus gallolyticus]SFU62043.1 hypothetical protein SAMN05660328_103209 [Streptococcus gallolyticus]